MKLSAVVSFAVFAAAACAQLPTVYAAECTPEQLEMGDNAGEAALNKACPAVTESSGLDITNLGAFDVSALMKLSPCKDATCTAYLKSQVAAVPDCEFLGLNLKKASESVLKICVGIADGSLSEAEIKALFTGAIGNMTISSSSSGSESSLGSTESSVEGSTEGSEGSSSSSSSSPDSDSGSELGSVAGSLPSGSPDDVKPNGPAPSTVPAPGNSGSSVATIAGAAVAATATLASFLLI